MPFRSRAVPNTPPTEPMPMPPLALHLDVQERAALAKVLQALLAGSSIVPQSGMDTTAEPELTPPCASPGATAPPASTPAPAPSRPAYRGQVPPVVRQVTLDGEPAVIVALAGAHGRGHTMTLDADVWERIRRTKGDQWTRHRDIAGRWFVGGLADRGTWLAKAVLRAKVRGADIGYLNGDFRDCRLINLSIVTSAHHQRQMSPGTIPSVTPSARHP